MQSEGSWMYFYLFICLSARAVEWESSWNCYHSIAPCTSKSDISSSAICHLWRFILIDWYTRSSEFAASYIGSIYRLAWNFLIFWPSKFAIWPLIKLFIFVADIANMYILIVLIKIDKSLDDWVGVNKYRHRSCTLAQFPRLACFLEPTGVNLRASGVLWNLSTVTVISFYFFMIIHWSSVYKF